MRSGVKHHNAFDWAGHLVSDEVESAYRMHSWASDRANVARIGWVAGFVILFSFIIDFELLDVPFNVLMWDLSLRAVTALVAIAVAVSIRRAKFAAGWDRICFVVEIAVISCLFGIEILLRDQVVNQAAILIAVTTFLWFYVPIHAKYALASTIYLVLGQTIVSSTVAPVSAAENSMSLILILTLAGMGYLSKRSRERLRRENFLHDQRLLETNDALRREVETRASAEAREASARERFELLFRVSPMPLALTKHSDGSIRQINDALLSLVGLKEDQVIGRRARDFMNQSTAYDQFSDAVGRTRETVNGEFKVQLADNRHRDCLATSVRFELEGEDYVLTGLHDITERKQHEQELVDAKERAESAQKSQAAFLATMSHELRTPLNALLGFMQIVEMEDAPVETKQHLAMARESGEHVLQLISDILDLSKLAAGKIAISPVNVNCRKLAETAVDTFRLAATEKNIVLHMETDIERDMVMVDDIRIRQVLLNLIGNAVKFTPSGEISLRLTNELHNQVPCLRFEISDTGIGIEPQKLDEIFIEFRQADTTTTRAFGGSGLGLSISKKLIEAMGGEIGVTSAPGQGSTFWFVVPENQVELADGAQRANVA